MIEAHSARSRVTTERRRNDSHALVRASTTHVPVPRFGLAQHSHNTDSRPHLHAPNATRWVNAHTRHARMATSDNGRRARTSRTRKPCATHVGAPQSARSPTVDQRLRHQRTKQTLLQNKHRLQRHTGCKHSAPAGRHPLAVRRRTLYQTNKTTTIRHGQPAAWQGNKRTDNKVPQGNHTTCAQPHSVHSSAHTSTNQPTNQPTNQHKSTHLTATLAVHTQSVHHTGYDHRPHAATQPMKPCTHKTPRHPHTQGIFAAMQRLLEWARQSKHAR